MSSRATSWRSRRRSTGGCVRRSSSDRDAGAELLDCSRKRRRTGTGRGSRRLGDGDGAGAHDRRTAQRLLDHVRGSETALAAGARAAVRTRGWSTISARLGGRLRRGRGHALGPRLVVTHARAAPGPGARRGPAAGAAQPSRAADRRQRSGRAAPSSTPAQRSSAPARPRSAPRAIAMSSSPPIAMPSPS